MFTVLALVLNLLWSIFHMQVCPYFATRGLRSGADIVFCPYNYLIDPVIRKSVRPLYTEDIIYSNIVWTVYFIHQWIIFYRTFQKTFHKHLTKLFVIVHACSIFFFQMEISLKDQVVILDEAHNMEDTSRESAGEKIGDDALEKAVNELDEMS